VSRFRFIYAEKANHSSSRLCCLMGVSRAGYYTSCNRPPSARSQADAALSAQIRQVHTESRGTYGTPRIHAQLRENGIRCGRKRVARLLRVAGLRGYHQRKQGRATRQAKEATPLNDSTKILSVGFPGREHANGIPLRYAKQPGTFAKLPQAVEKPRNVGAGGGDFGIQSFGVPSPAIQEVVHLVCLLVIEPTDCSVSSRACRRVESVRPVYESRIASATWQHHRGTTCRNPARRRHAG